jgi:hypothetical protein
LRTPTTGLLWTCPQVTAQEKMPCSTVSALRAAAGPTPDALRSALSPATTAGVTSRNGRPPTRGRMCLSKTTA